MDYRKTNPAVIKSQLSRMEKEDFINHNKEIKAIALKLIENNEIGNLYRSLISIMKWSRDFYLKRF